MRHTFLAALALLIAGPAMAEDLTLRDLNVVPAAPSAVPAPVAAVALDAWFDRADATYTAGDSVRLFARASDDGYLTAFSIGPTGDVTQIYPNAFHPDNFVRAGATVEIPGYGSRAVVSGPVGYERIEVVLTRGNEAVCAPTRLYAQGPFRGVMGGAPELQRDLAVVAASEPGGRLATIERGFRTVPAPYAAYPAPSTYYAYPAPAPYAAYAPPAPYYAGSGGIVVVVPSAGYPLRQY